MNSLLNFRFLHRLSEKFLTYFLKGGRTALVEACKGGHITVVELLVDRGANADVDVIENV